MWEFLAKALAAVPSAASSNLAFVAYALAVLAYSFTVWRVSRNKNLLENLKRLPEKDRLKALEIEMGGVRLAKGISPEQWVRSQVHRYYLIGFTIACATILLICGVAVWRSWGTTDVSVDPYKTSQINTSEFTIPTPGNGNSSGPRGEFKDDKAAKYHYEKNGNQITIEPQLQYLDKERRGEVVEGFEWSWQPFNWDFPILSVKIVNNSKKTILLTEANFQIDKSKIDTRPIIVVIGPTYLGSVQFINDGWGDISNVTARFNVAEPQQCAAKFDPSEPYRVSVNYSENSGSFPISGYVPDTMIDRIKKCSAEIDEICAGGMCESGGRELAGITCLDSRPRDVCRQVSKAADSKFLTKFIAEATKFSKDKHPPIRYQRHCSSTPICVQGKIGFFDADKKPSLVSFSTIVVLESPGAGAPRPPSYEYDVLLEAGKTGYIERKAISQEIKPGEADQFLIKVASDKSADFHFVMNILEASGSSVWRGDISLGMLVPRSGAELALRDLKDKAP